MVVGDDVAIVRHDEAGTDRLGHLGLIAGASRQQVAKGQGGQRVLHFDALTHGDIHHGGLQLLGQVGKAGRSARTGHDGPHLLCIVLGDLGASGDAADQRKCGSSQKQRRCDTVYVLHVFRSLFTLESVPCGRFTA